VRWDKEIKDALAKMDVFIPLVSVNFAVSPVYWHGGMPNREEAPRGRRDRSGACADRSSRKE
jgi:hypothetical protein